MSQHVMPRLDLEWAPPPRLPSGIPILYEDEDEGDMGEANLHVKNDEIVHVGIRAHLAIYHPECQSYSNMNLYYLPGPPHPVTGSLPYISPDNMVVKAPAPLPEDIRSYTIGKDGPVPLVVAEVLSQRSAQQRDLKEKMEVCAKLAVAEYILIDETGKYLRDKLLLKRLQPDGSYKDDRDPDGGVTSKLGFRLVFREDGLHVVDQATGRFYVRPLDAEKKLRTEEEARRREEEKARQEADARQRAEEARRQAEEALRREEKARRTAEERMRLMEEQAQALEEELRRLREQNKPPEK